MDQSQQNQQDKPKVGVYNLNNMMASAMTMYIGIITAVIAMFIIFFVSSIKPDGSIDFKSTFESAQFWVLTGVTAAAALTTSITNYSSTVQKEKATPYFVSAQIGFKETKDSVQNDLDLLPMFCAEKTSELRQEEVRDIVEQAGLNYKRYVEVEGDLTKLRSDGRPLEDWQIKTLSTIKSIKITPLRSRDILQEDISSNRHKGLLPVGEKKLKHAFIRKTLGTRITSIFLSNLVFGLGVVLGNWLVGLANALGVIMALASAIIAATDDARGPIRGRYTARGDLLLEFKSRIPKYRAELEKQKQEAEAAKLAAELEAKKKAELEKQAQLEKDRVIVPEPQKQSNSPLLHPIVIT